jgi:electron transfer flavoprotein alpha subunit
VLVVADHDNKHLNPGTLNTITAAQQLGEVDVLVAGDSCGSVAEAVSKVKGVSRVLKADKPDLKNPRAERLTEIVLAEQTKSKYTHLLAAASANGKNFIPRVGAYLDVQPISDVQKIIDADTFVRPIYAGNALLTLKSKDSVKVITIRTTGFPAAETGGEAPITAVDPPSTGVSEKTQWVSSEIETSERPELTSAARIVSAGRGIKAKENLSLIFELADAINAGVGASRAVVDAGWAPNDMQIGQTGKVVAPTLYVAVGISGAIQHLAGMKGSKTIVAINNDADAPIFGVADYGLVADLFVAVPELVKELKN